MYKSTIINSIILLVLMSLLLVTITVISVFFFKEYARYAIYGQLFLVACLYEIVPSGKLKFFLRMCSCSLLVFMLSSIFGAIAFWSFSIENLGINIAIFAVILIPFTSLAAFVYVDERLGYFLPKQETEEKTNPSN